MKSIAQGGIVRALVALGLVSYQAAPALAGGGTANAGVQTQWVSQLIVKEKSGVNGTLQLQSAEPDLSLIHISEPTRPY